MAITRITLRPWQTKGIELSRIYNKYGIFADKGLGKTLIAVFIADEKIKDGNRVLITTKRDLIQTSWREEMRYFPDLNYIDLNGNGVEIAVKRRLCDNKLFSNTVNLFFINHEKFRLYYDNICYGIDTLIVDESSVLKNPHSQTSIAYIQADRKYQFKNIFLLSGLPAPNRESEYFTQMQLLDSSLFGDDYNAFLRKYFYRSKKNLGRQQLKPSLRKEFVDRIKSVSFFVSKDDVFNLTGKHVVKKISVNKYFDLTPEQLSLYEEQLDETVQCIKKNYSKSENLLLPHIGKLVKCVEVFCGFLKDTKTGNIRTFDTRLYDVMYNVLQENSRDQFIICCSFDYEQFYIVNYLRLKGHSFAVIHGKHKTKSRRNSITAFKEGYVQYLVAKASTIKFGHNLQNCNRMIYTSHDLSNENYSQSMDRIHRGLSQERDCCYSSILARGTIAEVIYKALISKKDVAIELLNHLKQRI